MKKIVVKLRHSFKGGEFERLAGSVISEARQAYPGVIVHVYVREHLWADMVVDSFGYWLEPGEPVEEAVLKIAESHLAGGSWREPVAAKESE